MLDFSPGLVLFWVWTVRQKAAGVKGYVGSEIPSWFASSACLCELSQPVLDVHILVTCLRFRKNGQYVTLDAKGRQSKKKKNFKTNNRVAICS